MQILEQEDDFAPRVSFERNRSSYSCAIPFSPLLLIDSLTRKSSFSYNKLPQEPLKLKVLKLDGSSFEIEVAKTGTVAELKQAVEAAFNHLPKKVSWSHVWGHFCLCYDGQKLLSDRENIVSHGIKDRDQLLFVRHLSINYNLVKTRSEEKLSDLEQPRISDAYEEIEEGGGDAESLDGQENLKHQQDDNENECVIRNCEYRLTRLLRRWFSYRRLTSPEMSPEQKSYPNSSRFANGFLGSFKNIARVYSNRYSTRLPSWKAE